MAIASVLGSSIAALTECARANLVKEGVVVPAYIVTPATCPMTCSSLDEQSDGMDGR